MTAIVLLVCALVGTGFFIMHRKLKSLSANQVVINNQIKNSMQSFEAKFNSLNIQDINQLKSDLGSALLKISELENKNQNTIPDTSGVSLKITELQKKIDQIDKKKISKKVAKLDKRNILKKTEKIEVQCTEYNKELIVTCIDSNQDLWKEQCLYSVTNEKSTVNNKVIKNSKKNTESLKEITVIEIQPKKRKLLNPIECKTAKVKVSTDCHIKFCPNIKTIYTNVEIAN